MPTLEQVEHEVLHAEGEMATAKAKKDYRRAAELFIKLPAMHDRHSAVASEMRMAMNRKELGEETQRLEGEVRYSRAICPSLAMMVVFVGTYFSFLFAYGVIFVSCRVVCCSLLWRTARLDSSTPWWQACVRTGGLYSCWLFFPGCHRCRYLATQARELTVLTGFHLQEPNKCESVRLRRGTAFSCFVLAYVCGSSTAQRRRRKIMLRVCLV